MYVVCYAVVLNHAELTDHRDRLSNINLKSIKNVYLLDHLVSSLSL